MSKAVQWLDRALIISPIHYTLCIDEKAFKSILKKYDIGHIPFMARDHADATTHFLSDEKNSLAIVTLRITKKISKQQMHSLLAHEAVHIWQEIKEYIGEYEPSKEFEAYSIQRISQELFYEYERLIKNKQPNKENSMAKKVVVKKSAVRPKKKKVVLKKK